MKKIFIAGFQKNSFVDYPAKITSVVFLGGCNFRCYYCHNHNILCNSSNNILFDDVLCQIRDQIGFIDGVVITGGEPTLHPRLIDIIKEIRALDKSLLIKLDTNGTNPDLLRQLIDNKLIDYVAMDIKAPLEQYDQITSTKTNITLIQESINILKLNKINYQFRTTLSPLLKEKNVKEIGKLIDGAPTFQLQQFVPNEFSNSQKTIMLPYTKEQAKAFAAILEKNVGEVLLRGF